MTPATRITPVILSGGAGARLWPLSRKSLPKQLLALVEARTMLQATVARVADVGRFAPPLVVTAAEHAGIIAEQLQASGVVPGALLLEPSARNTSAAIALATLEVARQSPDALLLVMPSDHVIADVAAFLAAVGRAEAAAQDGWLTTFGIAPDRAETGYGYIQAGAAVFPSVQRVERFVEKPDRDTAIAYLAAGDYFWNAGIFLFRADAMLAALALHAGDVLAACAAALAAGERRGDRVLPEAAAFAAAPSISIDYAVFERADRVAMAPAAMGWSDIGSWDALRDFGPADADGNVAHGEVVAIDTQGCLLRSDGPVLAAVGVQGLNIVATGDAVLVTAAGSGQEVRRVVDRLHGAPVLARAPVERHGWGSKRWLSDGDTVTVSELSIAVGETWPGTDDATTMTLLAGAVEAGGVRLAAGEHHTLAVGVAVTATVAARLLVIAPRR